MQAAEKQDYVGVSEYLVAEAASAVRHEYLGGLVYAMAVETRDHNQICQNLAFALRPRMKGGPCQMYLSDIRVNFHLRDDEYYYYPDLVVTCDKRDNDLRFIRYPKLIIEVLSASTERMDKREKFFAYTNIGTLEEYVLVAQASRKVTVFRRADNWKGETVGDAKGSVALKSLRLKVPLADIYEGV